MTLAATTTARRVSWILGILVALVVAAWAAVAVLLPPARVRALVERQIGEAVTRDVRFGDAGVSLWPPVRISLADLELAEPGGFDEGTAFRARAFHLDLDLFALLGRRVVVRRLVLDRPFLHLVLRPDGTTNFDDMAQPPAPGQAAQPMDADLREVRIDGGRVLLDAIAAVRRTTFEVSSKVALRTEGGGARIFTSGQTRVRDLASGPLSAVRLADLGRSLAALEWRLEHAGAFDATRRRLAFERLALAFGGTALTFSGIVDEPGPAARLDLRARGEGVDLAEILRFLSAADAAALHGIQGAGRLDFDLAVRGRLGPARAPAVSGALAVSKGSFRYPGAAAAVRDLAFHARFAPDSFGVGDLTAIAAAAGARPAPLRATMAVTRFADPRVRFTVQGDIDLAAVAPLLAGKGTAVTGRAIVSVGGNGRARDPGSFALQGRARLAGVQVTSKQLPRPVEQIRGDIEFSPERATVRGLSLTAGKSSMTLDATVTRPLALAAKPGAVSPAGVDFALRSPYLDLAELMPATAGAAILPNATGSGSVRIDRLIHQKLDVSRVSAQVDVSPTVLTVPDFQLDGYGGAVRGKAAFDVGAASPGFKVDAQVDSVEADRLLGAWTPARGWLHGALNTTVALSGDGNTPADIQRSLTAVGMALVSQGTLGPGPALEAVARTAGIEAFKEIRFRDLRLPFRVERGRMITDPVVLEGPYGRWQLIGGVGFDGAIDYAVSITLPQEIAARLGARSALAAGALADDRGNVLLDLRVTGTAKAPRVAWDPQAMRDRIAGRLSQALLEQRAKLENEARDAIATEQRALADSLRRVRDRAQQAVRDSLRRRTGDLLKGFFGTEKDSQP